MDAADILLSKSKPEGDREHFLYYGKQIVIPLPGDIINVTFSDMMTYPLLVTQVINGSGKMGISYKAYILDQKKWGPGVYSFDENNTRSDYTVNKKFFTINPKDRKKILNIKITNV